MKKILLFFVMVLLVLVSARSLFSYHGNHGPHRECVYLKMKLDVIASRNIDESSLHALVRLLTLELKLVNSLLSAKTGYDIDKLLLKKEKLLRAATKTATYVYNTVMNFATSDILFVGKKHVKPGEPLQGADKRRYLRRMKKILAAYKRTFGNKYYNKVQRTLGLST